MYPPRHQPLIDLLPDDALSTDVVEAKADEDLISFDAYHDSFVAEEILNAPLTMKTEEVKAKAIFKVKAFIAQQEEDSKSDTTSVGTIARPKLAKPAVALQTSKVINPIDFPPLASQHKPKEIHQLNGPTTIETVAVTPSINPWGVMRNLFQNATAAPATTATSVVASPPIAAPSPLIHMLKSLDITDEGTKFVPHDPNDPAFKIGNYYVSFIGKYKCPHLPGCM